MKLGTPVGLDPGLIVLDGDTAPPQKKKGTEPPIFGPCLLWPNGWMDKVPLGTEEGLGPGDIMLDGDPAQPTKKGEKHPNFRPMSVVTKRMDGSICHLVRS